MKINVEAGTVVRLDRKRSTSVRGGEYDISKLPEKEQKRILSLKGVSEAKDTAAKSTQKKES